MSVEPKISDSLKQTLEKYNQTHLLSFFQYIESKEEKQQYISDLESTDFELSADLYSFSKNVNVSQKYTVDKFTPLPHQFSLDSLKDKDALIQKGYEEIYQGKVALLILAGGLGTRLGFDKPKGMYNIKMPSNKYLFEYLSNRFLVSQLNSKERVKNSQLKFKDSTLLIMTNIKTNDMIKNFFEENNYFNLKKENVIFFPQNEICTLGLDGKINNVTPSQLYKAPDGNGGCFTAMKTNKILEICVERGIDFINVCSVDNPISAIMDPLFVGVTVEKGKKGLEQMSAKYLQKIDPKEKIGNFLIIDNHPMMLDYMEIPDEISNIKDDKGNLVYGASNILNYLIGVKFLKKILLDSPEEYKKLIRLFHTLHKKMDVCIFDEQEKKIKYVKDYPSLKFEIFINSIFEFTDKDGLLVLEGTREREFAPVKNNDSEIHFSPMETRKRLSTNFKENYIKVGGKILNDCDNILEFSMLINFDGENEESFFKKYPYIPKEIDMSKGDVYFKNNEIEK